MPEGKVWPDGYISGQCGIGACEGVKKLSPSGSLFPSCTSGSADPHNPQSPGCHHKCHKDLYDIRQFIAEQNELAGVPEPESTPVALAPVTNVTPAVQAPVYARHADGVTPPDHPEDAIQTVNGRRGRGSLEMEVKAVCNDWIKDGMKEPLTPKIVAMRVHENSLGEKFPSTGAVDAVWRRWVRLGFATMESKPTRFTGYTEEGLKLGLHEMKRRRDSNEKWGRFGNVS